MLKIAVVDHHLNNYHADNFIGILKGALADQDAEIVSAYESDPVGEDWCLKHAVPRAKSVREAVEQSDAVLLLAPDNIEAHLKLAAPTLTFGKPTFIDKLLADTLASAKEMVARAQRAGAPIFASSALRHALELGTVLAERGDAQFSEAYARGMGHWPHYGIHTLSLVLPMMGSDITRVCDTGTETSRVVTLDYSDGRRAHLEVRNAANQWDVFPWNFGARLGDRYITSTATDYNGFYRNQLKAVLDFFKSGMPPAPVQEGLMSVAVMEAAEISRLSDGAWIGVDVN